jgi:hypothetical protein
MRFAIEWVPSGFILDGVESQGAGFQVVRDDVDACGGAGLEGQACVVVEGVHGALNVWRQAGSRGWEDEEFLYVSCVLVETRCVYL